MCGVEGSWNGTKDTQIQTILETTTTLTLECQKCYGRPSDNTANATRFLEFLELYGDLTLCILTGLQMVIKSATLFYCFCELVRFAGGVTKLMREYGGKTGKTVLQRTK